MPLLVTALGERCRRAENLLETWKLWRCVGAQVTPCGIRRAACCTTSSEELRFRRLGSFLRMLRIRALGAKPWYSTGRYDGKICAVEVECGRTAVAAYQLACETTAETSVFVQVVLHVHGKHTPFVSESCRTSYKHTSVHSQNVPGQC